MALAASAALAAHTLAMTEMGKQSPIQDVPIMHVSHCASLMSVSQHVVTAAGATPLPQMQQRQLHQPLQTALQQGATNPMFQVLAPETSLSISREPQG